MPKKINSSSFLFFDYFMLTKYTAFVE